MRCIELHYKDNVGLLSRAGCFGFSFAVCGPGILVKVYKMLTCVLYR